MTKAVILTQEEWDRLPLLLATAMAEHAAQGYGFDVVFREDGRKLEDRHKDWWAGTMNIVFWDVVERMQSKDPAR